MKVSFQGTTWGQILLYICDTSEIHNGYAIQADGEKVTLAASYHTVG